MKYRLFFTLLISMFSVSSFAQEHLQEVKSLTQNIIFPVFHSLNSTSDEAYKDLVILSDEAEKISDNNKPCAKESGFKVEESNIPEMEISGLCTIQIETPNGAEYANTRQSTDTYFVLDDVFKAYKNHLERSGSEKLESFEQLENATERLEFLENDDYEISNWHVTRGKLDQRKYKLFALAFEDLKDNFDSIDGRKEIYKRLKREGNLSEQDIREFSNLIGEEYLYNDDVRNLIVKHYERDTNDIWESMQQNSTQLSGDCFHDAIRHYETLTEMGIDDDKVRILFTSKSNAFHTVALFKGEDNKLNLLSYENYSRREAGQSSVLHQTRLSPGINAKIFEKVGDKFVLKGSKDLPKGAFFKELTGDNGMFADPNQVLYGRVNKVQFDGKKSNYAVFQGTSADGQKIVGFLGQNQLGKKTKLSYIPHYSRFSDNNIEGTQIGIYTSINSKLIDKNIIDKDKFDVSFETDAKLQVFTTTINEETTWTSLSGEESRYTNDGLNIDFAGQIPLVLKANMQGRKVNTTVGVEHEFTPSLSNMSKFMKPSAYLTTPANNTTTLFAKVKTKDDKLILEGEYYKFHTLDERIIHLSAKSKKEITKNTRFIVGADYYNNLEFNAQSISPSVTVQCEVKSVQVDVAYKSVFTNSAAANPIQIDSPHSVGICIKRKR